MTVRIGFFPASAWLSALRNWAAMGLALLVAAPIAQPSVYGIVLALLVILA